ncbi:cupin domain-containing protein [bacterium]|nr:cupin domain-containing protein [bacterium]
MAADDLIRILKLQPHPKENGFYMETYRNDEIASVPLRYNGPRSFSTAIYFLLKAGGFSEMHRLQSDEIFHFYRGAPAEMLLLKSDGQTEVIRIGNRVELGEMPQVVVPRGCWQGMLSTGDFTLLGTTVAPGFEYSDYESGNRAELISKYPAFAGLIRRLTNGEGLEKNS